MIGRREDAVEEIRVTEEEGDVLNQVSVLPSNYVDVVIYLMSFRLPSILRIWRSRLIQDPLVSWI